MRLKVSPNRMSLLMLRKRIALAVRGHKLLQDKQTQLMKVLREIVDKVKESRRRTEALFIELLERFAFASGRMNQETWEVFLASFKAPYAITYETRKFLHLKIKQPSYARNAGMDADYSVLETTADLDSVVAGAEELLAHMLALAALEETVDALSFEIQKTRRRVNALEYILVPSLEETISFITMRLEELERQDLTRLMRVKEILKK
jgi:V/A-type H+-transporting ATPase subunit D